MQNKFLRTFALSVVFVGILELSGVKPSLAMYEAAFEDEIVRLGGRNLFCRGVKAIGHTQKELHRPIGQSRGPGGITTHYDSRWVPDTVDLGYSACERCHKRCDLCYEVKWPDMKITRHLGEGPKLIITAEVWDSEPQFCEKPLLSPEMTIIWQSSAGLPAAKDFKSKLNYLWQAARKLDASQQGDENKLKDHADKKSPLIPTEYKVERESKYCCGCSIT